MNAVNFLVVALRSLNLIRESTELFKKINIFFWLTYYRIINAVNCLATPSRSLNLRSVRNELLKKFTSFFFFFFFLTY